MMRQTTLGLLGIASAVVQIWGTFMMANALLVTRSGKASMLFYALFSPKRITEVYEFIGDMHPEDKALSVRGLSLLAIGFIIDVLCGAIDLILPGGPAGN